MDKEEENKTTTPPEPQPIYPTATKGSLSDDHSQYGTEKTFAGGDLDKDMGKYFVAFVIVMGLLFIMAVKSFIGEFFF
jgi:hypothetical protein